LIASSLPPMPPSTVTTTLAPQSLIRLARDSALNPENYTGLLNSCKPTYIQAHDHGHINDPVTFLDLSCLRTAANIDLLVKIEIGHLLIRLDYLLPIIGDPIFSLGRCLSRQL
jgi:hypothetical protein